MVLFHSTIAQKSFQQATLIKKSDTVYRVLSIADQISTGTFIEAEEINREVNPKKRDANVAVPGKGLPVGQDPLWDPYKSSSAVNSSGPILTFEAASSNVTPTDPTGAVGPDHYINAWNSSFRIWDKEGNPLTPPASLATIFPGQSMGDPIVLYDHIADRFLVTQFYANGFLIAVSQGPDPVNSGWYTYQYPTNTFPDYPKYSLWSDGYYITANKNSFSAGTSEVVYALEREKMLEGDPTAQIVGFPLPTITTSGFFSPLGFNVNGPMPPAGNAPIVYMQDDVWNGVSTDHLKIWNINVDWDDPSSSTISDPQILETTPYDGLFDGGSFSNLPQPSGPDLDALQATIMYMAQYRRFSTHNSVVFNFVVDLDGSDNYSGIRWYELRQESDGDDWEIYQEGTYAQPDGHSAYAGTMAMDANGNIGMAYSVVSTTQYPSLRFTGRFAMDPLNEMTIAEESYAEGTMSDPSFRYGDYSQMTVDPTDDKTFWTIAEYFTGGTRKNQVGVFKIAPDLANDVGIVSIDSPANGLLTNAEPISVTIRNFGVDTQSDIPVSFQIDDGAIITETYSGSIPSNTNVPFTFTATGDFSEQGQEYMLKTITGLGTDENTENDTLISMVRHLYGDDLGIVELLSPVSGAELSSEPVTVTIRNFGATTQTDFEVAYILNDEEPVIEQVAGPLESEASMVYTFSTPGDFTAVMDHTLTATSALQGDEDLMNDSLTVTITNTLCQPDLNCEYGVGIFALEMGGINNISGCDPNGYGNYSNLMPILVRGGFNDMTISTEYGSVYVKVWIDYDDNFVFEPTDVVVDDYIIAEGMAAGSYTETIEVPIPNYVPLGEHMMRIKVNYNDPVPENPCEETLFGETEDYTVLITEETDINQQSLETNPLIISNQGDNRFRMTFQPVNLEETLTVSVHNLQGQTLISNRVPLNSDRYSFDFNMSYAPRGVYLLRLGSASFGKVKRFVVE
jgi:hypothetical protein